MNDKLYIKNDEIKQVDHTKFLGVIIDSKLNWDFHINYIKQKIAKSIGILSKARKYLNKTCLITLYYSFLYPLFTYCIEVWGSACSTRITALFKLQKKSVRIITSSPYRDPSGPLFEKLKILPLHKIYVLRTTTFMFKCYHHLLPIIFDNMFIRNEEVHNYQTRFKTHLRVPAAKLLCLRQSVRVKGVYWWNYFHDKLNINCSLNVFKKSIKKIPGLPSNYVMIN